MGCTMIVGYIIFQCLTLIPSVLFSGPQGCDLGDFWNYGGDNTNSFDTYAHKKEVYCQDEYVHPITTSVPVYGLVIVVPSDLFTQYGKTPTRSVYTFWCLNPTLQVCATYVCV